MDCQYSLGRPGLLVDASGKGKGFSEKILPLCDHGGCHSGISIRKRYI